jgi:hypothetical protein
MPIGSWGASALLLTGLAACDGARRAEGESGSRESARAPSAPSTGEAAAAGDSTRLRIRTGAGATYELTVARDSMVAPGAPPTQAEVVGELPDAIVVVDTYPSAPLGMSFCQAGEERFLRVVATRGGRAAETLRLKVASCRENLELATPGLEWVPDSSAVRVHWLLGPGGTGAPSSRTIRIGADGRPLSAAPPAGVSPAGATARRRAAPG